MKKYRLPGLLLLAAFIMAGGGDVAGQGVGIGTTSPHPSAKLDISSPDHGLLIPRMTTAGINAIANPARGLLVYDSTQNQLMVNMGSTSAPKWQSVVTGSGWALNGNSGTNPRTQFIGTTDAAGLQFRVKNQTAGLIDSAQDNTFLGYLSGQNNGFENTGLGNKALQNNISGDANTAVGTEAMRDNTIGSANVAIGTAALASGTNGFDNIAIGDAPLINSNGESNIGIGGNAQRANVGGKGNIAIGSNDLFNTTNSSFNTVVGYNSFVERDMGFNNTVLGANINGLIQDGLFNIIAVGQAVPVSGSNQARFGNLATNSIGGFANWTNFSDGRYKKDLKENVPGIDFIMRLRPLTYHLDVAGIQNKLERDGRPAANAPNAAMQRAVAEKGATVFTGFSAQEVEKAARDAGFEFSGVDKPADENGFYGLRYGDFVVPLVKAVQEQQRLIEKLEKKIDALEKKLPANHP